MEHAVREKFMSEDHQEIWQIVDEPEAVLAAIENAQDWIKDLKDAGKMR
jgi:predicted Rossmann-fold nucleotide-binding protein